VPTHPLIPRIVGWVNGVHRIRDTVRLTYPEAGFSVHMLLCHRHVDMALWCLKSFSCLAELSPRIWIHDDGTLTETDVEVLREHLSRCTVISRGQSDQRMDEALEPYPYSRQMRQERGFPGALKLWDPWIYSTSDVIVLVDSDILFFQRPSELLDCAKKGKACFMPDYQDAYAVDREEIGRYLHIEVLPKVNSGLLSLGREDYDLELIEKYFKLFSAPSTPFWQEQTAYALLMTTSGARPLSDAYQISRQPLRAATVSHHFVNDGSRLRFLTRGVKTLKRRGTLDAILR
jgi:hypothetical protein